MLKALAQILKHFVSIYKMERKSLSMPLLVWISTSQDSLGFMVLWRTQHIMNSLTHKQIINIHCFRRELDAKRKILQFYQGMGQGSVFVFERDHYTGQHDFWLSPNLSCYLQPKMHISTSINKIFPAKRMAGKEKLRGTQKKS